LVFIGLDMVAHICNASYSRGRDRKVMVQGSPGLDPISKTELGVRLKW
jgi:hypothetical protein